MSKRGVIMTSLEQGDVLSSKGPEKKRIQVQIDRSLAEEVELILHSIGLNPTTALTIFYKQIIKQKGIPFKLEASERDMAVARLASAVKTRPVIKMSKQDLESWLEEDEY